jgi:hypothetical protein
LKKMDFDNNQLPERAKVSSRSVTHPDGGRKLAHHCQHRGTRSVNASTTRDLDPVEPVEDTPPAPADSQSMKLTARAVKRDDGELIDNLERRARLNCNQSGQQETKCCLFET